MVPDDARWWGNPAAWWDVGGERAAHDTAGTASGITTVSQGNDYIGVSVTSSTIAADAWWAPIETVSNSEDGFERVYQGSSLFLSWPVRLEPGGRWSRTIRHVVQTTRDRAAEEADAEDADGTAQTAAMAGALAMAGGGRAGQDPSARGLRATG